MNRKDIWQAIEIELRKAKKKFPTWPDHVAAKAGIVCEEAGELMQACLQWKYQRSPSEVVQSAQFDAMREEAIQTAVTAIRFLENLKPWEKEDQNREHRKEVATYQDGTENNLKN